MKTYTRNNIEIAKSQPFDAIISYAKSAQIKYPSKENEKIIRKLEKLNAL